MNKPAIRNAVLLGLLATAGLVRTADVLAWEGIYGGINAGWAFDGDAKIKFPPDGGAFNSFAPQATGGSVKTHPEGSAWGLHLGENRRFGNWIVGLEGTFNWSDIDDSKGNAFGAAIPAPTKHRTSQNWLAALTPRVGYAFGNWLPYAKAGLAVAEYENSFTAASGRQFKRDHIHNGWTAGLGVEYALSPAWMLGVEYNYYSFNSKTYGGQAVPDNLWVEQHKLDPTQQTVMARLSYNFGGRPKAAGGGGASGGAWQGLYGGLDALWGFDGDAKMKFPRDGGAAGSFAPQATGGSVSTSPEGGAWGLHLGQSGRFGNWVVGLEASFSWADIDDSKKNAFGGLVNGPTTHKTSLNWLGALTPRVGYAFGNWLPYAKVGLAVAEYENRFTGVNVSTFGPLGPNSFKRDHIHTGWTAGLGVAYAFSPAWVLGVEYNYYDFNSKTYGGQPVPDNTWPVQYKLEPTLQTLGARLSYRF